MSIPAILAILGAPPVPRVLLAEGGSPLGGLSSLVPFILMIGVFYFLLLRPMKKQEEDRKKRMAELKRNDRIVLTGGLLGRISKIEPDDEVVVVELAERVKVRVLKKDIVDLESNALKKDDKKPADKKAEDKKPEPEDEGDEPSSESRKAG